MEMLNHFGYQVGQTTLESLDPEETQLHLRNQERERGTGFLANNIYTLGRDLLRQPYFEDILEEIESLTLQYAKKCGHDVQGVKVTQSTSAMLQEGGVMVKHKHSNSYISGVVYLSTGSSIRLYNPMFGKLFMLEPKIIYDENNPCTWEYVTIKPEPGKVLFFPSEVPHDVESNHGIDRFSIAFNTMPIGKFGGNTSSLNL